MHRDEVHTDVALVRRLISSQFPEWTDLPVTAVDHRGTDNALYRLGEDSVVRLPTRERTVVTLAKERRWLPHLAAELPLAVPAPLAHGIPGHGYPFEWAVYSWLPGVAAAESPFADQVAAAVELAGFIAALERIDPSGGPPPGEHNFGRGEPLSARDPGVRKAIAALGDALDAAGVAQTWEEALRVPEWEGEPVWVHGDLDARNVLVVDGRLSGVIDFGGLGVGDPAADVMAAWKLFSADARRAFREALAVDGATWARAKGWALSQALGALSYYTLETNPVLVREAQRWLAETLADRNA
jgi:aminoglycoside phosphotransferase (APT) family kinase protein